MSVKKRKIRKYMVDGENSIGYCLSVVDAPAVESNFQYFSKEKIEKFVASEEGEKRMIYGCALRPDFQIYRYDGKDEYYLEFSADAIDKISKNYFKMGFQNAWTEQHNEEIEGLTITESWIKCDNVYDKSIALGLDNELPIGTWFIGCYCENDEIWEGVKNGTYNGFSIEALISLEEFNKIDKSENNMVLETNEMFWTKLKDTIMGIFKKEEIAEMSGMTVEQYDEEVKAIEAELEEQTPPTETVETPTEQPQETVTEAAEAVETQVMDEVPTETEKEAEKPSDEVVQEPNPLEETIKNLLEEVRALKEMNQGLQDKVADLGKKPSTDPINTNARNGGQGGSSYDAWRAQMAKYI